MPPCMLLMLIMLPKYLLHLSKGIFTNQRLMIPPNRGIPFLKPCFT